MLVSSILAALLLAPAALSHGSNAVKEAAERRQFLTDNKSTLAHCAEKLEERGRHMRAIKRRAETASKLMKKPNIAGKQA
jgi:hypothetical protein